MFCRVEIFNGQARGRVLCTHYITDGSMIDAEAFAERERRAHSAEGFRLLDIHTGARKEFRTDKAS